MRDQAKKLIQNLEQSGIIKRVVEPTETYALTAFVRKPSGDLRFVVDFTAFNLSVIIPVHSFPSSDQIANQIKPEARHFATLDFLNRYFQLGMQKDRQLLMTFIVKWGRYCFLRALQGLASPGDEYNTRTEFFPRTLLISVETGG